MVLLSGHDSKKYQAALRLKQEIAENPNKFSSTEKDSNYNREVDEFGEIATTCVQRSQKRLTPEEIEKLIVEYQTGKTPIELSAKYGCHRITVTKILKRNGVEIRPHNSFSVKRDDNAIIVGYRAGKSTIVLPQSLVVIWILYPEYSKHII